MNRKLWENLASLFSVQALNYIVPLFTLPFLTRVLGPSNWGSLAFLESYSIYVSLLVDYGFGLSASRDIAQMRESKQQCSEYLANVLGAQIALALASACVTALLLLTMPGKLSAYRSLVPLATLLAFSRSAFPSWFFQGLEKMKMIAVLNIVSNLLACLAVFGLVRNSNDIWVVIGVRTCACMVSAVAALVIVYRSFPFIQPSFRGVVSVLKGGGPLFLFKGLISLYTTANVLLLGVIAGPLIVAWFAGAEKVCKAALNTLTPINQTFYPRINYLLKNDPDAAAKTIRLSICLTTGLGLLAGLVLFLGAPGLVALLLGKRFENAVPILRVMSFLPPLIALSNALGVQWMLSLRMEKLFTLILLLASSANVGLALLLVPTYGAMGMAISVVVAEAIVTGGVIAALMLKGCNPFSRAFQEARV